MPIPHGDTLLLMMMGGILVYAVIGSLVIGRWARGRMTRRPISARADPEGWVATWLPLLIAVEAFALSGGALAAGMLLVALPASQTQYTLIGAGGGLVVVALCLAGFDIAWVARVRALGRQQPMDQAH